MLNEILMGYVSIERALEFDYTMINIIIRNDRILSTRYFITPNKLF